MKDLNAVNLVGIRVSTRIFNTTFFLKLLNEEKSQSIYKLKTNKHHIV